MNQSYIGIFGAGGFVARALLPLLVSAGRRNLILIDSKPIDYFLLDKLTGAGARLTTYVTDRLPIGTELDAATGLVCLAGATSVDAALSQPAPAIEANFRIALNVAEWVRIHTPHTRVIYMSSDEVLGEASLAHPLPESAPYAPTQPYAASKAAAEVILHNYRDVYGIDLVTLRSCNLVGPGQTEPKLIPVAVRCLVKGLNVPIHGSGQQLREWMAVEDLCQAIIALLQPDCPSGVYHAASGKHFSVNEVAAIVASALGLPLRTENVPDRSVQDKCYAMSFQRLAGFGWRPSTDPRHAIEQAAIAIANSIKADK